MPDKVTCCGEEMLVSNGWFHCKKCQKRLKEVPHEKETNVIAEMLVEYVEEYDPFWEELRDILHELWRQGHYEGYEPQLPPEWRITDN